MYATISDLLNDLFGIYIPLPIQTFGFFVAISFLLAAWTLSVELKRKEAMGLLQSSKQIIQKGQPATPWDFVLYAIAGLLIGYKLLPAFTNYSSLVNNPQDFILSLKGSIPGAIIGAGIGFYLKYRENQQAKLEKNTTEEITIHPYQLVGNLTLVAAVSGLLGAKVFHNLENINELINNPVDALLSFSGLTMYGGLIVGGAGVIWYGVRNGIPWKHLIDAAAPGLMLAYGVGRIGCHMSGDGDWGIVNLASQPGWLSFLPDWTWAYNYPNNVLSEGIPIEGCVGRHCNMLPEPVYPTPLYEAVACISLFSVLWFLRQKVAIPGFIFSIYLIMNGIERFLIEKIRVNPDYHVGNASMTQAEIISVALFMLGISGLIYFSGIKKQSN
jgi:phosphatidylglycerol---prolipoprotein diacylglyceryl transferase